MSWDWRGNLKIIRTDAVNPFSIYMSNKCDSCLSKKEIAHIRILHKTVLHSSYFSTCVFQRKLMCESSDP